MGASSLWHFRVAQKFRFVECIKVVDHLNFYSLDAFLMEGTNEMVTVNEVIAIPTPTNDRDSMTTQGLHHEFFVILRRAIASV